MYSDESRLSITLRVTKICRSLLIPVLTKTNFSVRKDVNERKREYNKKRADTEPQIFVCRITRNNYAMKHSPCNTYNQP